MSTDPLRDEHELIHQHERDRMTTRGYFGIGIDNHKTLANIGTLWRSAYTFGAAFIFTVARRYPKQASDTLKAWRHVPLYNHASFAMFSEAIPFDCEVIGVELSNRAKPLETFVHPDRALYILGAEDDGLSMDALDRCDCIVQIDSRFCLNVAVAGSIVMWHRAQQRKVSA